mmetsp:Transcript_66052/g.137644  ORF Transcript_66052/g.137644 Transcript_66052/m.137644 type:complete len:427 (+) Transcript_66052:178-1458(+)
MESEAQQNDKRSEVILLLSSIYGSAEKEKHSPVGMTAPLLLREFDEFWEFNGHETSIRELFPSQVIYVFLHVMLERNFPRCAIDPILRVLYRQELRDEPLNFHMPLKHHALSNWREGKEGRVETQAAGASGGAPGKSAHSQEATGQSSPLVKQEATEASRQQLAQERTLKLNTSLFLSKTFQRALDSNNPPLGMTEMLLTREFYEFWEVYPQSEQNYEKLCPSQVVLVFLHDLRDRHFPDCSIEPIMTALLEQELQDGAPGTSETPLNNQAMLNQLNERKARDAQRDMKREAQKLQDIKIARDVKASTLPEASTTSAGTRDNKGKRPARLDFVTVTSSPASDPSPVNQAPRLSKGVGRGGPATSARSNGMGWRPGRLAAISARPRRAPSTHMALRSSLAQQLPFRNPTTGRETTESVPRSSKRAKQ